MTRREVHFPSVVCRAVCIGIQSPRAFAWECGNTSARRSAYTPSALYIPSRFDAACLRAFSDKLVTAVRSSCSTIGFHGLSTTPPCARGAPLHPRKCQSEGVPYRLACPIAGAALFPAYAEYLLYDWRRPVNRAPPARQKECCLELP